VFERKCRRAKIQAKRDNRTGKITQNPRVDHVGFGRSQKVLSSSLKLCSATRRHKLKLPGYFVEKRT
jgi:hypothetical protein